MIWAGARVLISLFSLLAAWAFSGPSVSDRAGVVRPDNGGSGFFALLHHWDSNYFLSIAGNGYFGAGQDRALEGYFPGYPLTARGLSDLFTFWSSTVASITAAMWVVSAIASLAAAAVLWRLVDTTCPPGTAAPATLLFVAGPYAVFLAANYSESLYLAFAVAAWYCATKNKWWLAGCWCAGATFTRINGAFLVIALIVVYVGQRSRQHRRIMTRDLAWVALAFSGVLVYFGYLAVRTGDLFAWLNAQRIGWGREFHPPWSALYQTAGRVIYASTFDRRLQFALDIAFGALVLLAVMTWLRRREWAYATYAALTLLAMTTSFTFVSLARNTVTLFPLAILAASTAISQTKQWRRSAVFGAAVALFLVNLSLFALGYWTD